MSYGSPFARLTGARAILLVPGAETIPDRRADVAEFAPDHDSLPPVKLVAMSWPPAVLQSGFARGVPDSLRPRLEALTSVRRYAPGEVVFREGAAHDYVHLIASGHVRLEMAVPQRGRVPILTLGPGDLLAWSPFFDQPLMTSTAVAMDAVETIAFPADALRRLCESEHEVGYHVMRQLALSLARRLLATRLQLLDLFSEQAEPPAPQRPAAADAEC